MRAFVYIMADFKHGRTYIGVTSNLVRRVMEHREGLVDGYTKKNNLKRLVYFEEHHLMGAAIQRETSLKRWYQQWKYALIEEHNSEWRDLWDDVLK
jgi:putative endonuclease